MSGVNSLSGIVGTTGMTSPSLGCVLTAPGGNFTSAPGTGGAFMGSSSVTSPRATPCESEPQPGPHEHAAKPSAPRREAYQTLTPTRSGPRFGGSSLESTPGPRFGGVVATAMGSALRTAVSRVGNVVALRASPQSSEGFVREYKSVAVRCIWGPSISRGSGASRRSSDGPLGWFTAQLTNQPDPGSLLRGPVSVRGCAAPSSNLRGCLAGDGPPRRRAA